MTDTNDASLALQTALYARLTAALTALCKVYDYVPPETDFPYVVLREETVTDASDKDGPEQEFTVTVNVWDRADGAKLSRQTSKAILAAVYNSLHEQTFTIEGFTLIFCIFDQGLGVDLDEDGLSWHGIDRYRIRTKPSS